MTISYVGEKGMVKNKDILTKNGTGLLEFMVPPTFRWGLVGSCSNCNLFNQSSIK